MVETLGALDLEDQSAGWVVEDNCMGKEAVAGSGQDLVVIVVG
jgi:hypothetical protein